MYAWLSAILKKRYQIKVHTTNSINAIAMNHIPPWRNDVITEDVVHGIEIVGFNIIGAPKIIGSLMFKSDGTVVIFHNCLYLFDLAVNDEIANPIIPPCPPKPCPIV